MSCYARHDWGSGVPTWGKHHPKWSRFSVYKGEFRLINIRSTLK